MMYRVLNTFSMSPPTFSASMQPSRKSLPSPVGHEPAQRRQESAEIIGPVGGGAMDARHVEPLVRKGDDTPKPCGSLEAHGECRVEVAGVCETAERVGIGAGCAQSQLEAHRHRDIDNDLNGLPEMQDDGVRGVRRRREPGRIARKPLASEVAVDRRDLLGENLPVQRAQPFRCVSTAS